MFNAYESPQFSATNGLSPEEAAADSLIELLDREEAVCILRDLPERLQELSARHRSFAEVRFGPARIGNSTVDIS